MTQDMLKGGWKQLKGAVQKQWGKLTNDDMDQINGNKEMLIGKLQQRYGYSKAQAEKNYEEWVATQDVKGNNY